MFRIGRQILRSNSAPFGAVLCGAILMSCPVSILAQRGAGGIGGGLAGGGGLSGHNGSASGLDTKDDLKSFHEVLAVQANGQQTAEFHQIVKKTEDANGQIQSLPQRVAKSGGTAEIGDEAKTLVRAIEAVRAANSQFVESLSDRQKSGLREAIKRLAKTDSEVEQQCRKLDADAATAKLSAQDLDTAVQALGRTLAIFHEQQLALGEEMSIVSGAVTPEVSFTIPPASSSAIVEEQNVSFTTSGTISMGELQASQREFAFELTTDLSDLQHSIGDLVRAALNRSEECGEQLSIQSATLIPAPPSSSALVDLHYERWACFGGRNPNEMAEGNGRIEIKLTPALAEDGTLRVNPEITRIDAQGLVADLLRSGLGESVRDKIAEMVAAAILRGSGYKTVLPPTSQGNMTFTRAQFQGSGAERLSMLLIGKIMVPDDKIATLAAELKAMEMKGQSLPAASAKAPAAQSNQR